MTSKDMLATSFVRYEFSATTGNAAPKSLTAGIMFKVPAGKQFPPCNPDRPQS